MADVEVEIVLWLGITKSTFLFNLKPKWNSTFLGARVAWIEIMSAPESELEEEGMQVVPVAVHPLEGVVRVCDDIYWCMHLCVTF